MPQHRQLDQHVQRWLVALAVVATCVLFTARAYDPVNVIKLSALIVLTLAVVAVGTYGVLRDRVLPLPVSVPGALAVLLGLALVAATVAAPVTNTALWGTYGRNSGLFAYGAALVLFVLGLHLWNARHAGTLLVGVVLAGLFTATYGLMQEAGHDNIPWNNPFNPIIAGLGNPNFASGYLGIAASVAAGAALWRGWALPFRATSGATALLCLLTAALSNSVQGPIAAAAGLFVVALSLALSARSRVRLASLAALGTIAVLGAGTLLVGLTVKAGPAASIFDDAGSTARVFYWRAALQMFSDRPLFGRGLDSYGSFWRTARSPASVGYLGGPSYSDASHSVPLQMLAQGGLLLGLSYLALIVFTGWCLARGLLRLTGPDRMLLGALGAGWAAYQVQSFVSIDQVPLLVLHLVLASAVIAVSGSAGVRQLRLPGAAPDAAPAGPKVRKRGVALPPARRSLTAIDGIAVALVAMLALAGSWQALDPLRASLAVKRADDLGAQGATQLPLAEYQRARSLMPSQSLYAIKQGQQYQNTGDDARALATYREAIAMDGYEVNAMRAAAALAEQQGDVDGAHRLYDRAVTLDPVNSETLVPAAGFELRHDGAQAARTMLEQATRVLPTEPAPASPFRPELASLLATLGDARKATGDAGGARTAYERALAFVPGQPVATAGLAALAGG